MKRRLTLLNYYGLSNGTTNLFVGQLSYTLLNDFSFQQYSRRRTFWSLLNLYRSKPLASSEIELRFDHGTVHTKTDSTGAFWCTAANSETPWILDKIVFAEKEVLILENLYARTTNYLGADTVVVSDIDDTLLHSHIRNRLHQFRTLMFTAMEKRRKVIDMHDLINRLEEKGAAPFYLSNSEQNLYPLIFRFLTHNDFPEGPLFLKQWRTVRDFLIRNKVSTRDAHKLGTLENLIRLFPDKKYILVGDNTQRDLSIYLQTAEKFPDNVKHVVIRKVHERFDDLELIGTAQKRLSALNIELHYAGTFTEALSIPV